MKKIDFLLIYEHKVRELEALCLIKYELERRGYSVEIQYIDDFENAIAHRPTIYTKILCVMACYNNATLKAHIKKFVKFDKVIDLQWENIVYPFDKNRKDAFKNYMEIGRDVVHISWGRDNYNRLVDVAGLDRNKVKIVGHIGMDFLRYPLKNYYLSRQELFEKYGLPPERETILFASSFYGDCLEEAYIDEMCMRFGQGWRSYYINMLESQDEILRWFKKYCEKNRNTTIIFRPHPGHPSINSLRLEKEQENFKVIGTESVKQWILACDKIYTANSSVMIEAFFAKKACGILMPFKISDEYELDIIKECSKIVDYESFEQSVEVQKGWKEETLNKIKEIYDNDKKTNSYIRFADVAEEILNDDYYMLSRRQVKTIEKKKFKEHLITALMCNSWTYGIYIWMLGTNIRIPFLEKQRAVRKENISKACKIIEINQHELASEREIREIINKIENAIEI